MQIVLDLRADVLSTFGDIYLWDVRRQLSGVEMNGMESFRPWYFNPRQPGSCFHTGMFLWLSGHLESIVIALHCGQASVASWKPKLCPSEYKEHVSKYCFLHFSLYGGVIWVKWTLLKKSHFLPTCRRTATKASDGNLTCVSGGGAGCPTIASSVGLSPGRLLVRMSLHPWAPENSPYVPLNAETCQQCEWNKLWKLK